MTRNDIILTISIIILVIFFYLFLLLNKVTGDKQALVYYENDLVLTIDLTINEEKEYKVDGYNGEVIIKTKKGAIKVEEENSPLNLCSKQGWVTESYETVVCLPNKIIIKIDSLEELDSVVK